ncbi:MAG: class I SAM-dependent methyltransferase [Kofleriaceae bacterium]
MSDRKTVTAVLAVAVAFVLGFVVRPLVWSSPAPTTGSGSAAPVTYPAAKTPVDTTARQKAFDAIYTNATWGAKKGTGTSGVGSTLRSTLIYRTFLKQFLEQLEIKSVVDAGCGDWEFSQAVDWTGIDYKGYDIVASLIEQDTAKYGKPNIQFFKADFLETDLPKADLLISKNVLQHLSNADVMKFLPQLKKYKHVLLIDGVNAITLSSDNPDIPVGGYRELDLTAPPFNLTGAKLLTYWDGFHMQQTIHLANP